MLVFCELNRMGADKERAVVFAAEFLVWWFQVGRTHYDKGAYQEDSGLRSFACESITVLGGWKAARRTLASAGV